MMAAGLLVFAVVAGELQELPLRRRVTRVGPVANACASAESEAASMMVLSTHAPTGGFSSSSRSGTE